VIVLEADGNIDESHGYAHPIVQRLEEMGVKAETLSLCSGEHSIEAIPDKPVIISGGMTEVTADVSWIKNAKRLVKERIERERNNGKGTVPPLLGICFGAQLLAETWKKGSVKYLDDPEIGITEVVLKGAQHPLFTDCGSRFPAYTFHYNQIKPQGLSVLSCQNFKGHNFVQAFNIPDTTCYGLQFHPEFTHPGFVGLLHFYGDLMTELGLDKENIINSMREIPDNSKILKNFVDMNIN